VRCLVECLAEQAQKVIARETGFLGDLIQVERMVVAMIDKLARASEPLQFVLTEIAVSPDGNTIAVGGFDPLSDKLPAAVRFLDATTLKQRHSIPTGSAITGLAFSPDGTSVLGVVDGQKGIAVWPVE